MNPQTPRPILYPPLSPLLQPLAHDLSRLVCARSLVIARVRAVPTIGRRRVLRNAMRVARKTVLIADIDPDFHETLRQKPMEGATFLAGEPYVLNYLDSMDNDVLSCAPPVRIGSQTWKVTRETILPKHVVMWRLDLVE